MNRRAFLAAAASGIASPAFAQQPGAPLRERFSGAASYSADRLGAAFVVARNGVVLAEDYPGGLPDARWSIGAGTRVFAPLLAASLVKDGLMSLDEPVALTIGDWGADPAKNTISIRALLNGTSGVAFARGGPADINAAIALTPSMPAGQQFSDDAAPYVLLGEIARRKLISASRDTDPAAYLTARTLLSIGCVPIAWTRNSDGSARFDTGVQVSARGWAQVGELIRRDGVWRAAQLVDGDTISQACIGSFAEAHAGMGVYLAAGARTREGPIESDLWRMNPPAPGDLVMAAGEGGQRLYIIPSANLVVARMARTLDPHDWSDGLFLTLVMRDL